MWYNITYSTDIIVGFLVDNRPVSQSILIYIIYCRFLLDKYIIEGNTLTFNNSIYTCKNSLSASDTENIAKTIGIGINGERTITDYIWPNWVMEYKNDKEHNRSITKVEVFL